MFSGRANGERRARKGHPMANTRAKGVIHGKTIELAQAPVRPMAKLLP
ncbi:MAG: hypothetical protein ACK4RK_04505 [Gemmataceae bacterium]